MVGTIPTSINWRSVMNLTGITSGFTASMPAGATFKVGHDDPIFAAIETHRAVRRAFNKAVGTNSLLEQTLAADKRRTSFDVEQQTIIATDDPEWIASEIS